MMKFSLFYEMQINNPTRAREAQFFQDCAAEVKLADDLGYHCVWAVEHHGLYEYAHSSAPEVFLSFVAGQTRNIRLGHGISLTPYRFNHPIRVAERVATLDILSGGRVSWGSGKSSSNTEAEIFEIDRKELMSQWEEALHMIPRIWQDEVFQWDGHHYHVPPTHIVPKPLQQPHPPIFVSGSYSTDSFTHLGMLGVGALNFSVANLRELQDKVRLYKTAVAEARPQNWQKNDYFGLTVNTCVLPDDDEAWRYGFHGARFFRESFDLYYRQKERPPLGPLAVSRDQIDPAMLGMAKKMRMNDNSQLLSIFGDPALAREKVTMFQEAGVDELMLIMQLGTIPHEVICRSLTCFAQEVVPYFQ
jgi:alkanesulfonate monooxygenase SsuD/methylene tetrahydromethanopterin reductase-like flavin-dependent oxidoreductase (luciferase family)